MKENSECEIIEELKTLSWQLKSACNDKGIEIDPTKSAVIIHKIGLAYLKQKSNKISIIQGIGLLNSAIKRNPKNIKIIKQDLSKACQFVLQEANAQDSTAGLIEKVCEVKHDIESMRNQTNKSLAFLKTVENLEKLMNAKLKSQQKTKTKLIEKFQLQISKNYKSIMKKLSQYCERVMGPPPCKFSVVGMGSLARKEITPYSDFEHIILLENNKDNEDCLEYFRWFSVIFHIIVLNLQETIIRSLNIKYLNDKTDELGDWFYDTYTNGISFDGMMVHACKFPLGRTQPTKNKPWTNELIKPVEKMLEYLSDDTILKQEYHLSDILTETCFVYGDQALHDAFKNGIKLRKSSKTDDELFDEIRKQVKEDLDNFATRIKLVNLKLKDSLNVKQMFYRTSTLFITALGRIYETESSSCFDIINELAEQRKISGNAKHKLSYAVAIACEIRLRVYMQEQSQCDHTKPHEKSETMFDEILKFVDKELIVSYFQITYCLQREIVRLLGIKGSHIYSNPRFMNITICYALRLDVQMLLLMKKQKDELDSKSDNAKLNQENDIEGEKNFSSFDKYLGKIENELESNASKMTSTIPASSIFFLFDVLGDIAFDENYEYVDEQTELLSRVKVISQRLDLSDENHKKKTSLGMDYNLFFGLIDALIAKNLIAMNKIGDALMLMRQVSENFDETKSKSEYIAWFYFLTGDNWIAVKEYEKSLNCLQLALGIYLSEGDDCEYEYINEDGKAMMNAGIGTCLLKLNQFEESLTFLKKAIRILEEYPPEDFDTDVYFINPTSTYHNLGNCLMQLGKFGKAKHYFFKARYMTKNEIATTESDITLTQPTKKNIFENQRLKNCAGILHDLGLLHMKQNNLKKATNFFQKSFNIYNKLPNTNNVDETRSELLKCYMKKWNKEEK